MASFPIVLRDVPCSVASAHVLLLASIIFTRAAHSNAAADVTVVAHHELATLQHNDMMSAPPRLEAVVA